MFWLIGLLIGGNIFFAAMFWQVHRAYCKCNKQYWRLSEMHDERMESVERLIALADRYQSHVQELQHIIDMLKSERISPDDLTQYPN